MMDVISGADIINQSNTFPDYDRFENLNSSTYLNNGYLTLPPGVYFTSDFSVTFWINFKNLSSNDASIFGFANSFDTDAVEMYLFTDIDSPTFRISVSSNDPICSMSSNHILLPYQVLINNWYHIAFILRGNTGFFYINAELKYNNTICGPNYVIRNNNYIGKTNIGHPNLNGSIGDFRIYNRAILFTEITSQFNNLSSYFFLLKNEL